MSQNSSPLPTTPPFPDHSNPEYQLWNLLDYAGKDTVIKACRNLANNFPETEKVNKNHALFLSDAYALISRQLKSVDIEAYDQIHSKIVTLKKQCTTEFEKAQKLLLLLIDTLKKAAELGRSSPNPDCFTISRSDAELTEFLLNELPNVLKTRWQPEPKTSPANFLELISHRIPQDIKTLSYILDSQVFFAMSGERWSGWRIHEGKAEAWLTSKEELREIMSAANAALARLVDLREQLLYLDKQKHEMLFDLQDKIHASLRLPVNENVSPDLSRTTIIYHLTQYLKAEETKEV